MNLGLSLELQANFPDTVRGGEVKENNNSPAKATLTLEEKNSYNIPDPN